MKIEKRLKGLKRILEKVGVEILHDVIFEEPRPPILTGRLRASHFTEVRGNDLYIIAATPYARRWHDSENWNPGPVSRQDGKVGPHWITKTIENNMEKYKKMLREELLK